MQLQPVGRATRHVLDAVEQRTVPPAPTTTLGPSLDSRARSRCGAEAPAAAAQRGPHGGARRRAPRRDGVTALPDRDRHGRAARAAHERRERPGRAEPRRVARGRGLQAPARVRGGGTRRRPPRRWAPRPTRRSRRGRPGRQRRGRPTRPRARNVTARTRPCAARALDHDHAAAVGGDTGVDRAVAGVERSSARDAPEGRARARGAPAHAGQRPESGSRARADHEGPAVAVDRQGGADAARRDDLRGAGGRGGDEHQPPGPSHTHASSSRLRTLPAPRRLRPRALPPAPGRDRDRLLTARGAPHRFAAMPGSTLHEHPDAGRDGLRRVLVDGAPVLAVARGGELHPVDGSLAELLRRRPRAPARGGRPRAAARPR